MTLSTLWSFLAFFFGFSFLVFIHELGHFIVARWAGIKCTQFAVGMGQAVCSWRKGIGLRVGGTEAEYHRRLHAKLEELGVEPRIMHGEPKYDTADIDRAARELGLGDTEYRLNWMPLGGYVKMLGQEDMDPAARSDDPRSFNSKSVGARMAVISAGVIMNLVFGIILLAWAFMLGVNFPTNIAGEVVPYSPAWSTYARGHEGDPAYHGLRPADKLVALDGDPIRDFLDLKLAVALASPDATLDLKVERPGEDKPLHFLLKPIKGPDGLLSLGVAPTYTLEKAPVLDPTPKDEHHESRMRLASVNGRPVADYAAYAAAVSADPRESKTVTFIDDKTGRTLDKTLTPRPVLQRTDETDATQRRMHLLGMRPAVRIEGFAKKSPAQAAGMKAGDLIARLNDSDWPTLEQVSDVIEKADSVDIVVWRGGEMVPLPPVKPRNDRIGITLMPALDEPIVADVLPGTPAAALRLPAGSRITSLNGKPVTDWADMQLAVADAEPGELPVAYVANIAGNPTETGALALTDESLTAVRYAGFDLPRDGFALLSLELPLKADDVVHAAGLGLSKTKDFMVQAYLMIARLFQRTVGVENLVGPVGIVHVGTSVTQERGMPYLLFFLGLLSVNLAVINFLPIPIVDGGHAVFLIIEKLKGSPVSATVQAAATYVGLGFIGLVFIVVTYNDILKLWPQ